MTTHYIDVTLLPDPEFSREQLLGALVSKLHRALVQLRANDIGISFPEYSMRPRSLGRLLRLHSGDAALQHLMAQPWLHGMREHVNLTRTLPVPPDAAHRLVQRCQFKTNAERLRRRRMRRKNETAGQAAAAIPDSIERRPDLPYLQLRSASTGQPFCLFVDQEAKLAESVSGTFNSYGLSQGASVPWF
jgi:CRISPR-associated endonuclease Csy4